jgi:predicted RNA binding protein YcfA (HicA-like mRNA interferase family)
MAPARLPSGINQSRAVKAFEHAGGELKKTKRGHAVLKMPNGRLVSLPSGILKKGLLENQIKAGGLTVDEFVKYL